VGPLCDLLSLSGRKGKSRASRESTLRPTILVLKLMNNCVSTVVGNEDSLLMFDAVSTLAKASEDAVITEKCTQVENNFTPNMTLFQLFYAFSWS
jgi:hypothetical protein